MAAMKRWEMSFFWSVMLPDWTGANLRVAKVCNLRVSSLLVELAWVSCHLGRVLVPTPFLLWMKDPRGVDRRCGG